MIRFGMKLLLATAVVFAGTMTSASGQTILRIGGGIGGSSWEVTAGKLAQMFTKSGSDIRAAALPGSMGENLTHMKDGQTNLGITYSFIFEGLGSDRGEFANLYNKNARLLAVLYPAYVQPLVMKDTQWKSIEDMATHPDQIKAAVLTKGSSTYTLANALFTAAGADFKKIKDDGGLLLPLNYSQGADGLKSGKVNIVPLNGPSRHPTVTQLGHDGWLLPISDKTLESVVKMVPGTAIAEIPADSYDFLTKPYKTFAVYAAVVINKDVPDDAVYKITKYFWENLDDFKSVADYAKTTEVKNAALGHEVLPLHPGAARYYKEIGLIK